jgi:putative PIN family toxin of toxin-antitoxin system
MRTLFTNSEIKIYVCDELLDEFADVSSRLKIRRYITDDDVQETYKLIDLYCRCISINKKAISPIRDKKDLYLLSLAETISADFILTGDKGLLSLQSHNQTKIVTYKEFTTIIGN